MIRRYIFRDLLCYSQNKFDDVSWKALCIKNYISSIFFPHTLFWQNFLFQLSNVQQNSNCIDQMSTSCSSFPILHGWNSMHLKNIHSPSFLLCHYVSVKQFLLAQVHCHYSNLTRHVYKKKLYIHLSPFLFIFLLLLQVWQLLRFPFILD